MPVVGIVGRGGEATRTVFTDLLLFSPARLFTACLYSSVSASYGDVTVVVDVVELPQSPEDDSLKRLSCSRKADELVTVGACV